MYNLNIRKFKPPKIEGLSEMVRRQEGATGRVTAHEARKEAAAAAKRAESRKK